MSECTIRNQSGFSDVLRNYRCGSLFDALDCFQNNTDTKDIPNTPRQMEVRMARENSVSLDIDSKECAGILEIFDRTTP